MGGPVIITPDPQPQNSQPVTITPDAPKAEQPKENAIVRFARSFDQTVAGTDNPSDILHGIGLALTHPHLISDSLKEMAKSAIKAQQDTIDSAYDYQHRPGIMNKIEGVARGVDAAIPVVGPAMLHAGDQAVSGDLAGAGGTVAGIVAPMAAAHPATAAVATDAANAIKTNVPKFAPAVEKFASSQVDSFKKLGQKPQVAAVPEAATLPPKAVSGAEDIFRAAAPTSKNAGFRENLYAAVPDLADIARDLKIKESRGGIINPDMRVRTTVDAIDSHLDQMYKTERAPQIQAHADVPVKVGTSPDSVRALEYLETTAGTEDVRALASKALGVEGQSGVRFAAKSLTLAEADTLAQAANKYLKSYERAPSDVQMQMQQTSPKVGGLKSLDTELGRSIDDALTSNGEVGIRDYERRYAALSEVRSQLRDRMNAVELQRSVSFPGSELIKGALKGKSGIASASQAAVADVNVGKRLQTGLQKLRETELTAKKPSR